MRARTFGRLGCAHAAGLEVDDAPPQRHHARHSLRAVRQRFRWGVDDAFGLPDGVSLDQLLQPLRLLWRELAARVEGPVFVKPLVPDFRGLADDELALCAKHRGLEIEKRYELSFEHFTGRDGETMKQQRHRFFIAADRDVIDHRHQRGNRQVLRGLEPLQ